MSKTNKGASLDSVARAGQPLRALRTLYSSDFAPVIDKGDPFVQQERASCPPG